MEFDEGIPLPIGTEVPQNTVLANSVLQVNGDNINIHDETDGGWPTIITLESNGHPVGIAVDYLGTWHSQDVGIEEVDLVLSYEDDELEWRAIVAFTTKNDAIERGRYETKGYNGYELVPWNDNNRFERIEELLDEEVTPIVYTEDHPTYAAHTMQEADNIYTLNRMFGIGELETLKRRRKRLFTKVVPRKMRWENKDTSLQNLAKEIVDSGQDVPQPADEPYHLGDMVRVYLGHNDPDSRHHRKTGMVVEVHEDTLDKETGRELDSYSYKIKVDGKELDVWFQHHDLVPE